MKKIPIYIIVVAVMITFSCAGQGVKEKYAKYKGHRIYYETRGTSPKTLCFIHGWTGNTTVWRNQLGSFGNYRVIAIDLPGNGRSSKDESAVYTMELFADSIIEVLIREKVKKAFFIGHSMGFAVAEIIAQKYPETCAGIVSVDGAHFELPDDPKEKEKWIRYNREFVESLKHERGRDAFIGMLFLPDSPNALKDEIFRESRRVPLSIGRSMVEAAEIDQKFWVKRRMDVPCLAIYSPAFHLPPDFKSDLEKMYPRLEYHEVKGVSHFFMLEIPYKLNGIIAEYLSRNY